MNTITFLPFILLDIIKYNEYKEKLKKIDHQYKNIVDRTLNGCIEADEMERIIETKKERCLYMASIIRTEAYLSYMVKEDRKYIINTYVDNPNAKITRRTHDIFMAIDL